jgi:hypothetical protein
MYKFFFTHLPLTPVCANYAFVKNLQEQTQNIMGDQSDVLPGGTGPSAAIAFPSLAQLLPNASDFHAFVNASLDQWAQEAVNAGAAVNVQGLLKQYELQVGNIFNDAAPVFEMLVPI